MSEAGNRVRSVVSGPSCNYLEDLLADKCRIFEVLLLSATYLILPNLPLLLLQGKLTLVPHGYVNVECLLLGICALFLPRTIVFLLLIAEMIGGFVYAICYSFQFTLGELLSSLPSVAVLPSLRIMEIGTVLFVIMAVAAALAYALPRPRHRGWTTVCVLSLIAVLSGIDALDGQNPYSPQDAILVSRRMTICPWMTLVVRDRVLSHADAATGNAHASGMTSASSYALEYLRHAPSSPPPNVVLVVVESWGMLQDPHLAGLLTAAYADPKIASAYDVSFGTVPFDGLTVPGEARELCESHIGFGITRISASDSDACLPGMFRDRGYETDAVHGYVGGMFQRARWYRNIGFERMTFKPDLQKLGLPICPGAFPGICDASIAPWIGSQLEQGNPAAPKFVYWVTLNSHIPVPLNPHLPADSTCATQATLSGSGALCSWFRLVLSVHESVAQLALQVEARPTVFVVVGDHAPPFASLPLRSRFSNTVVPFAILTPKLQHGSKGSVNYADANSPSPGTNPSVWRKAESIRENAGGD